MAAAAPIAVPGLRRNMVTICAMTATIMQALDTTIANVALPNMTGDLDDEWKSQKTSELPLGRFATVEEITPSVLLLAADPDGNVYVGQTLHPNSGDVMP